MIHFNELRITPDGKNLIVEAEIDRDSYFDNVSIDSIIIDSQDTYVLNGPSSNPIYEYTTEKSDINTYSIPDTDSCNPVKVDDDSESYCYTEQAKKPRIVSLTLSAEDLNVDLNKSILFVYAIATGTPAPNTPCGYDNAIVMKSVINLNSIYKSSMPYIREVGKTCVMPKGFIDKILLFKAFELCIRTCDYIRAIEFWKKYLANTGVPAQIKCSCNERTY